MQILSGAEDREKQVVALEEELARRRRDLEHQHSSRLAEAEATVRRLQVAPLPPPAASSLPSPLHHQPCPLHVGLHCRVVRKTLGCVGLYCRTACNTLAVLITANSGHPGVSGLVTQSHSCAHTSTLWLCLTACTALEHVSMRFPAPDSAGEGTSDMTCCPNCILRHPAYHMGQSSAQLNGLKLELSTIQPTMT